MKLKPKDIDIETKEPCDPDVINILKEEFCRAANNCAKFQKDMDNAINQWLDEILYGRSE